MTTAGTAPHNPGAKCQCFLRLCLHRLTGRRTPAAAAAFQDLQHSGAQPQCHVQTLDGRATNPRHFTDYSDHCLNEECRAHNKDIAKQLEKSRTVLVPVHFASSTLLSVSLPGQCTLMTRVMTTPSSSEHVTEHSAGLLRHWCYYGAAPSDAVAATRHQVALQTD